MLKRFSAVLVAAAMGAATLVAGPAAQAAAPAVKDIAVSPRTVVVTSSAKVDVAFSFTATGVAAGDVSAKIAPKGRDAKSLDLTKSTVGDEVKATSSFKFGRDEPEGDWKLLIKAGSLETSYDFAVVQVWETDIVGFGASPEPVKAGATLSLGGVLKINGPKGWGAYKDQKVYIAFKPAGGSKYERVAYDHTNWKGEFALGVKAVKTGWWRAEFDGVKDRSHSTVSDSDQVDVVSPPKPHAKADSRIKFNASPEPVKKGRYLYFSGKLQVWDWHWEGYGPSKVSIWFRTKWGGWKYVKTTWTNDSGSFHTKTRASKSGYWKAVFGGDEDVQYASSKKDWVKVKR